MLLNELIEKIKNERIYRGISQREMAKMIPMNYTSYNKIEKGHREPTVIELIRICKILKIDLTKEFKLLENDDKEIGIFD